MVNTASEHEAGRHLKLKLQQPPEHTPQIQDSLVATKLSWDNPIGIATLTRVSGDVDTLQRGK